MNKQKKSLLIDIGKFERYFRGDKRENFVNMDNEIFNELKSMMDNQELLTNKHRAFTFAYVWLISYLWKYSKYGSNEFTVKEIKSILGSNPNDKHINYIIKENGLLDRKMWTETTRDFPIFTEFKSQEGICILQLSNVESEIAKDFLARYNSRYTCKKPILQYERDEKIGLMFSRDDVFPISVFEFTRIVLCKAMGVDALFLYAYIKFKYKMAGRNPVNIYQAEMTNMLGFSKPKLKMMTELLVEAEMIHTQKGKKEGDNYERIIYTVNCAYWGKRMSG